MKNQVFQFKVILTVILLMLFVSIKIFANVKYIRLSYRDDPSTTVVIGWSNDGSSTNAKVYFGTTDFGTTWSSYTDNHVIDATNSYRSLTNNYARLTGLTPNTVYYFVIKDDQGISARYSFKTITDNENDSIKFISGGDTRTGAPLVEASDCRARRQNGNRLVAKIRPDFVAFTGDFIFKENIFQIDQFWADWLEDWTLTYGPDGRIAPCCGTFGNHEVNEDLTNFFDITNSDNYYALNFGGKLLRLYTLKSDESVSACDNTAQLNWFQSDLQAHTGTSAEPYWKFVQYHIPMVPHGYYSPNQPQIDCWANYFQPYKVRLSMDGHSHVVKCTWPIVPSNSGSSEKGFVEDTANGTVYIGEGTWGAPLRSNYSPNSWTRDQGSFDAFQVVFVSKYVTKVNTVKFENISTVGQLTDDDSKWVLPSDISIWTPANGANVILKNPDYSGIKNLHNQIYRSSVNPNPANKIINIRFNNSTNDKKVIVTICNGMAKIIKTIEVTDFSNTIKQDVSDLSAGTYFIYIKYSDDVECHKIIIAH